MNLSRQYLTLVLVSIVWAVLLGLAACSSDGGEGTATAGPTIDPRDPLGPVRVGSGVTAQLEAGGLEFQLALVEDGLLTFEEYERLIFAFVECVEDAGAEPEVLFTARNTYYVRYYTPPGAEPGDGPGCTATYWEPLVPLWSFHHHASEEYLQTARQALAECLRAAGIELQAEIPSPDDFTAVHLDDSGRPRKEFFDCASVVADEFRLPGFGGGG